MDIAVFVNVAGRMIDGIATVEGSDGVEAVAEIQVLEDIEASSATATGGHGAGVEDSSSVTAVHDLVEALDDSFEETVNMVGAGELEKRAKDLRGGELV